jgi:hypothetical protein
MIKTFLTLSLILAFSVSAIACDGSGKSKTEDQKPPQETERT